MFCFFFPLQSECTVSVVKKNTKDENHKKQKGYLRSRIVSFKRKDQHDGDGMIGPVSRVDHAMRGMMTGRVRAPGRPATASRHSAGGRAADEDATHAGHLR